jgi:hypothetical protein
MYGRFFPRMLFGLLVIVGIAGLGYYAYQMGVAQGMAQGAPAGAAAAAAPYFWHRPMIFAPFWGLGCLIPLVLLFLVFGGLRAMFWRGHMMGHGGWRGRWSEGGVPPMFEEWHKRSHEQKADAPGESKPEGKAAKA